MQQTISGSSGSTSQRGLSTKDYAICGVVGVVTFAVSFLLGGAITAVAGPGTSGIVTIVVTTMLVIIGAKIVNRFGAVTLMVTVFSVVAIPTTMFGPPGPQKVLIGITTGIVYDLTISVLQRRKIGYIMAGGLSSLYAILAIFTVLVWLRLPSAERLRHLLIYFVPVYTLLGGIGGWLGVHVFDRRLSKLAVVRNLQNP